MRDELQRICDNFVVNKAVIKDTFSFENEYIYSVCATIFTDKGITATPEMLKNCKNILKAHTGIFSDFRGNIKLPMISILATADSPDNKMNRAVNIHKALRENYYSSDFLPIAALALDELAPDDDYIRISERSRQIYNLMKKEHPFLTSSEDSVFATLLALSDSPAEIIVSQTEQAYSILKKVFRDSDAIQTLSHIMVLLGGNIENNCNRTIELYNRLKDNQRKYGKSFELAILAILSIVDDMDSVVQDIIEVDDFLSKQKGYGFWGIDKIQRIMHAAMLVSKDYITGNNKHIVNTAIMGGTVSLVIAEQVALMAAVTAANAAAAAAAASN